MGGKLGATPRFGKAASHPNISRFGAGQSSFAPEGVGAACSP